MRRTPLLLSCLTALALTSGCASADTGADDSPEPAGAGFPATIDTAFGEVTVEAEPQRIVALGWGDAETALALGAQPVGASDWVEFGEDSSGVGPWVRDLYDEAPEIIGTLEPDLEAIALLEPDLILDVKGSGDEERHRSLSQIATTVAIPADAENFKTTQEDQVSMIAAALGEEARGEELIEQLEDRITTEREAHPEWADRSVSAVARSSTGWGAYTPGTFRLDLLLQLGFTWNPELEAIEDQAERFSIPISEENLDVVDADLVVGYPIWVEPEEITENALWTGLPAVQDSRALVIEDRDLARAYALGSVPSTLHALDALIPLLEETSPQG